MRILHTMLRVGDLEKSITFYTQLLGMRLLRRRDFPDGKFTLAFLGYGDSEDEAVLGLTHNWEITGYDLGGGYGHIAVEVDDVEAACDRIKSQGGHVVRDAGPIKYGPGVAAFIEDPDGYKIQLLGAGI